MNKETIEQWAKKFGEAWTAQDSAAAMSLFDRDGLAYYESALKEPITSWDEVKKLWDVVPENQQDISFWFEVITASDEFSIIHWKMSRYFIPTQKQQEIDGIFQIKLNSQNLCTYFKQWRTVEEK